MNLILLPFLALSAPAGPALAQHADPHAAHRAPADQGGEPQTGHEEHGPAGEMSHGDHGEVHGGHQAAPAASVATEPHDANHPPADQVGQPQTGHEEPGPAGDTGHGDHGEGHGGHQAAPAAPVSTDPHAGHDMGGQGQGPQPASAPPEALSGPAHAADTIWGETAMGSARRRLQTEHGGLAAHQLFVERAEARFVRGKDGFLLDVEAWHGGDINKILLKGELEGAWDGGIEEAEIHALWSHAIGPWFDLQAGARLDARRGRDRTQLAVGFEGLAPYWLDVEAGLYLSNRGEFTARMMVAHDMRITQRLILQPRVEANFSASDIPDLGLGAGISNATAALRLRYHFAPRAAPYVGMEYDRRFGRTRDYRRAEGERPDAVTAVVGLRFWF